MQSVSRQNIQETPGNEVTGEFVDRAGERYYRIRNVDHMPAFLMSMVSDSDHWLFISSTGGLTAGRVSPETALFPYIPVDKVHECWSYTGSRTMIKTMVGNDADVLWQPFNPEDYDRFQLERNLYKNTLGNKLCFEEINHDLKLAFRYTWMNSERFGFVRHCELENLAGNHRDLEVLDGLQNILPAGTPRQVQSDASNLVDAYKWNELDIASGLAIYTLYSGITDRPQPVESLYANTVFCLGPEDHHVYLDANQYKAFRDGQPLNLVQHTRGNRGAFLVHHEINMAPGAKQEWQLVAGLQQSQAEVAQLRVVLARREDLSSQVNESVQAGCERLRRIMAGVDAFQVAAEENVTVHHYANALFNSMRGGIFQDQYNVCMRDFQRSIRHFNQALYDHFEAFWQELPERMSYFELLGRVSQTGNLQLERLCREYLPITFGRRHGDPSRPWNRFSIRLRDEEGHDLLDYQGNWRDIFQNWEALTLGYPEFVESVIAKFVNASTVDGYNPYRIEKEGIDWEIEDPEDPWSYIGYWGDHQIIYLLKLLEMSENFHPARLSELLRRPVFCYANVPYRIKSADSIFRDAKNTVEFDHKLDELIAQRVADMGADGKLLLDSTGSVYLVNLMEKLLVPLLSKLGNLVLDGGIWMNTQRPEWNDANNALVGQGLSMVTLYYLRRYIAFMQELLNGETEGFALSKEVKVWLDNTASILGDCRERLQISGSSNAYRMKLLKQLATAADEYRQTLYACELRNEKEKVDVTVSGLNVLLADAMVAIDHSIMENRRKDGLYEAYNILSLKQDELKIETLYHMLEGQVAALSSGAVSGEQALEALESLFASDLYRQDQKSFLLYPDRPTLGFLDKNCIPVSQANKIPLMHKMLEAGDERMILRDAEGHLRFHPELINAQALHDRLDDIMLQYADLVVTDRDALGALYDKVFNHQQFTGRSGGMFGFEGLGCIYWHMVSKLLLAVQECYFRAVIEGAETEICNSLGRYYYQVREGIGFNKSPVEYGAFPTDPYSHTTGHSGARQPGMTGQVKEEIITRFGELGIRVRDGILSIQPGLLRQQEFLHENSVFEYLDVSGNWQKLALSPGSLGFTWCQLPFVYSVNQEDEASICVLMDDGSQEVMPGLDLTAEQSEAIFKRTASIQMIRVSIPENCLFNA